MSGEAPSSEVELIVFDVGGVLSVEMIEVKLRDLERALAARGVLG